MGEKGFSEKQHINDVQFYPRIGDNLVARSRGSYSLIKVMEVLVGKFREHPVKVPESCFKLNLRVANSFPTLRGNNSTTTNYITGTANFNSNKDKFQTLSSQGLFESIVMNLYPNQFRY